MAIKVLSQEELRNIIVSSKPKFDGIILFIYLMEKKFDLSDIDEDLDTYKLSLPNLINRLRFSEENLEEMIVEKELDRACVKRLINNFRRRDNGFLIKRRKNSCYELTKNFFKALNLFDEDLNPYKGKIDTFL